MILCTDNSISRYYAESLVLLYFPGVKFPTEPAPDDCRVTLTSDSVGDFVIGHARIEVGDKTAEGEYRVGSCDKNAVQYAVGGAMIEAGKKLFGIVPPWGMMTGVRPCKTAAKYLDCDEPEKELGLKYLMSNGKAKLAVSTAKLQQRLLKSKRENGCSLYIAIPFCPSKCSYCSFTSFSSPRLLSLIPDYLERLKTDIENQIELVEELGFSIETVYIGGGTPTTLNETQLRDLLSFVSQRVSKHEIREFTVEAGRPDTINAEKLKIMRDCGVDRVSVNCQTLNDEILKSIGRHHTAEDFLRACDLAKNSGIRCVNVDLIAGLTGESAESFQSSVDRISALMPENITVHTFYAKRAAQIVKETDVYRIFDDTVIAQVDYADDKMATFGYEPYYLYKQKNTASNLENVGFALPGYECLYNVYMMEEVHSVFGAGASSMTKLVSRRGEDKILRLAETKYPYEYLDKEKSSAEKRAEYLRNNALDFFENN